MIAYIDGFNLYHGLRHVAFPPKRRSTQLVQAASAAFPIYPQTIQSNLLPIQYRPLPAWSFTHRAAGCHEFTRDPSSSPTRAVRQSPRYDALSRSPGVRVRALFAAPATL